MALNIVLIHPQIPQNTGNIARTCVVTGTALHIVKPMAFEITEKNVKRAGLDYWDDLNLTIYESEQEFFIKNNNKRKWFFSSKVRRFYSDAEFHDGDFLVFGSETAGLEKALLDANKDFCVKLPMIPQQRCLNLSNACCAGLYEALRQTGFKGLN